MSVKYVKYDEEEQHGLTRISVSTVNTVK
jgi:hypothetical protein